MGPEWTMNDRGLCIGDDNAQGELFDFWDKAVHVVDEIIWDLKIRGPKFTYIGSAI